jgi:two-component system response regulator FixJ
MSQPIFNGPIGQGGSMATIRTERASRATAEATVFVVDDDEDVRRAVTLLIRSIGLAVDSYGAAQDFLDHYDPQTPGCLVLDVRMPGMSGLELQKRLNSGVELPPIIFITAHGEIPMATQALRAGALDFIQKPFSPQALLERVREAIDLDRENRNKGARAGEIQERMTRLTDRERQITDFLARGESTKQIALQLSISPKTVDNHRTKIFEKMHVDNSTQLANLVALL